MMQRIGISRVCTRPYIGVTGYGAAEAGSGWVHPRFRRLPPPLIVVGMHRSGTSLVTGMLGALGVYVGPEFAGTGTDLVAAVREGRQSGYAEAAAFFRINELLLRAARCSWCRVEPFLQRRGQTAWAGAAEWFLRAQTGRSLLRDFLQPLPESYTGAWGWKDPRNSLSLPLWLRLFPEARIIRVVRDTDAVVRSLHQRARLWEAQRSAGLNETRRSGVREAARKLGLLAPLLPDPCLDVEYCYELSRVYQAECGRAEEGGQELLEVRYEEILADPALAASRLARFAGCGQSRESLRRAGDLVLRER